MNKFLLLSIFSLVTVLQCEAGTKVSMAQLQANLRKFMDFGCELKTQLTLVKEFGKLNLVGKMMLPLASGACKLANVAGGVASKGKSAFGSIKERAGGLLSKIRSRKQSKDFIEEEGGEPMGPENVPVNEGPMPADAIVDDGPIKGIPEAPEESEPRPMENLDQMPPQQP